MAQGSAILERVEYENQANGNQAEDGPPIAVSWRQLIASRWNGRETAANNAAQRATRRRPGNATRQRHSNNVVRPQLALARQLLSFELDGGMSDTELLPQLM